MESATNFTYISKKKISHTNRRQKTAVKKKATTTNANQKRRSRSRSRSPPRAHRSGSNSGSDPIRSRSNSLVRINDEDLKNFTADQQPKVAGAKGKERDIPEIEREVDTNIMRIKLNVLAEPLVLATGDPLYCKYCGGAFNLFSQEHLSMGVWKCDFCLQLNPGVDIDKEAMPKTDQVTYFIPTEDEKIKPTVKEDIHTAADPIQSNPTQCIIFCLDLSGSMDVSVNTPGLTGKRPTRIECMKNAISKNIAEILKSTPNAKVGFITFASEVKILGNGTRGEICFCHNALSDFAHIFDSAFDSGPIMFSSSISASEKELQSMLLKFKTGGSTALGPALLASIGIASSGGTGSKVILCTDGAANVGLGSFMPAYKQAPTQSAKGEDKQAFYRTVGELAQKKGIVVSLISISEEECNLDGISPAANLSGGDILKIDPLKMAGDLAELLSSSTLIGYNVSLKIVLHKALQFRNESEGNILKDGSLMKNIGNVTPESVFTFEYSAKSSEQLAKMEDLKIEDLKTFVFQAQVSYTPPGSQGKMRLKRVITMKTNVTQDKETALKFLKNDVLIGHARLQSANLAQAGNYKEAMAKAYSMSAYTGFRPDFVKELSSLYGVVQNADKTKTRSDRLSSELNQAIKYKSKK